MQMVLIDIFLKIKVGVSLFYLTGDVRSVGIKYVRHETDIRN